jgi:hypothetical protein
LQERDNRPTFATWEHFLIAGLQGKTPMAREVQVYLLRVEQQSRVSQAVEEETGLTPRQLTHAASPELQAMVQAVTALTQSVQVMVESLRRKEFTPAMFAEESPRAEEEEFLEISALTLRYELPRSVLNRWLLHYGYQRRLGDDTYEG